MIDCGVEDFDSWQEAWKYPKPKKLDYCEAEEAGGTEYSERQMAAAKVAGYGHALNAVETLASLCAEVNGYYAQENNTHSKQQLPKFATCSCCAPTSRRPESSDRT